MTDIIPNGIERKALAPIKDRYDNYLSKRGNEIYLKLDSEKKERLLGRVVGRELQVARVRSKHLFLKNSSYGFNEVLLKRAKTFDKVRLMETNTYLIPVSFILENGRYMFHKKKGFEKQLFVTLQQIEQFKVTDI